MSVRWLRAMTMLATAVFVVAPSGPEGSSLGTNHDVARAQVEDESDPIAIASGRFLREQWTLKVYKKPSENGTWYCDRGHGGRG
ncbi:MAG: hypothetical protein M3174_06585, partial [Actinomycetota bacterium]|nr:hypothetical protein [Actinomycetota bacterium]